MLPLLALQVRCKPPGPPQWPHPSPRFLCPAIGSGIGSKVANPTGANALYQGGMQAAQSNYAANAYNPFAAALTGFSQSPALTNAASNAFRGGFSQPNAGNLAGSSFDSYGTPII